MWFRVTTDNPLLHNFPTWLRRAERPCLPRWKAPCRPSVSYIKGDIERRKQRDVRTRVKPVDAPCLGLLSRQREQSRRSPARSIIAKQGRRRTEHAHIHTRTHARTHAHTYSARESLSNRPPSYFMEPDAGIQKDVTCLAGRARIKWK